MAAVTGTIRSVSGFTTPEGRSQSSDTTPQSVLCCDIFVDFAGTYATADDATIASVATTIQNTRRNGKTVTIIGAGPGQPGFDGTTPMGAIGVLSHTDTSAVTEGTLKCTLSDGTLTAEHGASLLVAGARPVGIRVTFKEV